MDVRSPFIAIGGHGLPAHLAAANGLPPQVYTPLVKALSDHLEVIALQPLAMRSPSPPPRPLRWVALADELAHQLQRGGYHGLIGLGHSLGGTLSLFVAARHPGLFRALVLLDPVIFSYRYLAGFALLRFLGLSDRFPLAVQARRRRTHFPSREAAEAHYRQRAFFRRWHPEAFAAYLAHGLIPDPASDGVRLAYPPEWEAAIFASAPLEVWRWARKVRLPTLVIYGAHSNTFLPPARRRLQRLWPQARFVALPQAGHMFPLEQPEATAEVVLSWLHEIGKGTPPSPTPLT